MNRRVSIRATVGRRGTTPRDQNPVSAVFSMNVILYDTTLRDGTQGEDVQMSVADKLQATELLDELGVGYVEGGWPGSNPRDEAFFDQARRLSLGRARLTAFGMTRRSGTACEDDPSLQALIRAEVPVHTIVGKAWKFQATAALKISPAENLDLIAETISYLRRYADEIIFDAEHYFDGFVDEEGYALSALRAAEEGGASYLALCDTNGGRLPEEIEAAVRRTGEATTRPLGIHTHNDAELAVANALAGVRGGATMVQGTINGYGERCGNANLVSIIPALVLKMGIPVVTPHQLSRLRQVARTLDEITNRTPWASQPYVGRSAFAHKGGMHVDAIKKNPRTYEHIEPERVGNQRRILMSDLSGKANVHMKAREYGIELDPRGPEAARILQRLKELENRGYQFESAGASFKLVVEAALGRRPTFFGLRDLQVRAGFGEKHPEAIEGETSAHLEIAVGDQIAFTTVRGNGPVNAMDVALRSLLDKFYPQLDDTRLVDYKVRVMTSGDGTGAVVRVLVQSSDGEEVWGTVGVSPNVIHASWEALVDALTYKLIKEGVTPLPTRGSPHPRARETAAEPPVQTIGQPSRGGSSEVHAEPQTEAPGAEQLLEP